MVMVFRDNFTVIFNPLNDGKLEIQNLHHEYDFCFDDISLLSDRMSRILFISSRQVE